MSNTIRIYKLAKELEMSSKELLEEIKQLDLDVKNHMSTITNDNANIIRELLGAEEVEQEEPEDMNEEEIKEELEQLEKDDADENVIEIEEKIVVSELADLLEVKANDVILKLMQLGTMASINQKIDFEAAELIAAEYDKVVKIKSKEEEVIFVDSYKDNPEDYEERAPIISVIGHVDHGKTSLLDAIRDTDVTEGEAGGITQHIGASEIEHNGSKIVFLDTPGHEAFTSLRARGARLTDIAILVVAADDGVMPQTIEAIDHAKAAGIPIIVAINKMDKPTAKPDRVKQELTEHGVVIEEWGGDTIACEISAITKQGIDDLLENILLVAEMEELKANPNRPATGIIVEANKERGRGVVATAIVKNGTLHIKDSVYAGVAHGNVKAMVDFKGDNIAVAEPSSAVELLGLSTVPAPGSKFFVVKNEKEARKLAEQSFTQKRDEKLKENHSAVSLDDLFDKIKEGNMEELAIVLKADAHGSIEALKQSLVKLSNDEVNVNVIHSAIGTVTESDVMLASASNAIIIGFNVRPKSSTYREAERENVQIKTYSIIYKAIQDVKDAMEGLLEPEFEEVVLGHIEVRNTFNVPNVGTIAGGYVKEGKVTRKANVRLVRDGIIIHDGSVSSLKRFKDDVGEVATGFECGIGIENYNDIKPGDLIEAYLIEEVKK